MNCLYAVIASNQINKMNKCSAVRQGKVDGGSDAQVPDGRVTVSDVRLHQDLRALPRHLVVRRRNGPGDQLRRSQADQHPGEEARRRHLLRRNRRDRSAGRSVPRLCFLSSAAAAAGSYSVSTGKGQGAIPQNFAWLLG